MRFNVNTLSSEVFSISTELPKDKDVDIHLRIRLDLLTTETDSIDNVLALGVGKSTDYYMANGNYVLFSIRGAYKTKDIHEEVGDGLLKAVYDLGSMKQPSDFIDILYSIRGIDLYVYIDGKTIDYYPRSLSESGSRDVFWIGYQLRAYKSVLQALISDFAILEK